MLRALTVAVVVFAAAPLIARFFSEPRAGVIIQVLALRPILQAAASIRAADLTRNLQFRGIAALKLTEALVAAAISIGMAPFFGVWALVAGSLAGPVSYSVLSYALVPYRPRLALHREATTSLVRFGRWIFLTGIVALVGSAVLHAVISRRLGTVELGLYFLAAKIAFLPTEVASDLVGGVAFPLYSRLQSDAQQARRACRSLLVGTAAALLPALGLLIALAPSLVQELLGPRWQGTAPIIQVLAVAGGVGLFVNAAAPIFKGVGQPSRVTIFRATQSVVLVALVWDFAGRFGLVAAAAAWIPAAGCAMVVGAVMLLRLFPGILAGLAAPALSILLVSIAGAVVAFALDGMIHGLVGFIVGGLVGALLVCALLWLFDRRFDLNVRLLVSKFGQAATGALSRVSGSS
jgi:O-antigen/teichoic acid export membrane protein